MERAFSKTSRNTFYMLFEKNFLTRFLLQRCHSLFHLLRCDVVRVITVVIATIMSSRGGETNSIIRSFHLIVEEVKSFG